MPAARPTSTIPMTIATWITKVIHFFMFSATDGG
jgi:hypothetical protein